MKVKLFPLVRGEERQTETRQITTFLSCTLLQSDTLPPVPGTTQGSRGKAGDSEQVVDGGRPEPETLLQVCQAQVAELEQWLDKTKVSLRADPQTPKMQQMVELELADCQVRRSGQFAAAIQTSCSSLGCVSAETLCLLLLPSSLHWLCDMVQKTGNCLASVAGAAFQGLG